MNTDVNKENKDNIENTAGCGQKPQQDNYGEKGKSSEDSMTVGEKIYRFCCGKL